MKAKPPIAAALAVGLVGGACTNPAATPGTVERNEILETGTPIRTPAPLADVASPRPRINGDAGGVALSQRPSLTDAPGSREGTERAALVEAPTTLRESPDTAAAAIDWTAWLDAVLEPDEGFG